MTPEQYVKVEQLSAWAGDHGHTIGELAHAWLLAQPTVCSVISGVTKLEQLEANLKAGEWALSAGEVDEVNGILAA